MGACMSSETLAGAETIFLLYDSRSKGLVCRTGPHPCARSPGLLQRRRDMTGSHFRDEIHGLVLWGWFSRKPCHTVSAAENLVSPLLSSTEATDALLPRTIKNPLDNNGMDHWGDSFGHGEVPGGRPGETSRSQTPSQPQQASGSQRRFLQTGPRQDVDLYCTLLPDPEVSDARMPIRFRTGVGLQLHEMRTHTGCRWRD